MTPYNPLARLYRLSPPDRAVVLKALVLLPAVRLLLYALGFKRTVALLSRSSSQTDFTTPSEWHPRAWHIMQLTRLAARRGLVHGNCLSQSLTLWWLLRHSGIASELKIGVRREEAKFLAHAWVELASFPLNDRVEQVRQYTAFDSLAMPNSVKWA